MAISFGRGDLVGGNRNTRNEISDIPKGSHHMTPEDCVLTGKSRIKVLVLRSSLCI